MIKILFAGVVLFVAMIGTAVSVGHRGTQSSLYSVDAVSAVPSSSPFPPAVRISSYPNLSASGGGDDGGLEENPFLIAFGITAIICLTFGFSRHHEITDEKREEEEAAAADARKTARFSRRLVGKEPKQ